MVVNGNGVSGITFGVGAGGAAAGPIACTRASSAIAASMSSAGIGRPPSSAIDNSSRVYGRAASVRRTASAASSRAKIAALGTR